MDKSDSPELFKRYTDNPIITTRDIPYKVNAVFNSGAVKVNDEVLLLMRIEDKRGLSHFTLARSSNGFNNWQIDPQPTIMPDPKNHPEEIWGIEDPRITYLEEKKYWGIVYTAYSLGGPLVSLATTKDFKTFKRKGPIMPPEDKDAALFPEQIDGRWALLHRPTQYTLYGGAHIWISFSPDLKHWGEHQILMQARRGSWWDANKIGLSPQPLKTEKGWLILYHGVRTTASGVIYRLGLALLDHDNPLRILARSDEWIFSPQESYELYGDVDKVVFPCGWILDGDKINLYYGGADKCIALATASLSEVLTWLEKYEIKKSLLAKRLF